MLPAFICFPAIIVTPEEAVRAGGQNCQRVISYKNDNEICSTLNQDFTKVKGEFEMNDNMKCVMIIDSELPIGVIANTSAILGVTLGKHIPDQVGDNVNDATNNTHLGIITIPITMLKGNKDLLKDLRKRLYSPEFSDLVVVDFSDVAQSCNIYSEYVARAASVPEPDHTYLGIALYGEKKKLNKLTGFLPLLR